MKKILLLVVLSAFLFCGCIGRQITVIVEIPKEVAIAKELRKIKELENNKITADANTNSISAAVFLPIVQKILSDVLKKPDKRNKLIYKTTIYDNNTISGKYNFKIEDLEINVEIKKEKEDE